jgi:F0F1-type ATP synthase delta subunit
MNKSELYAKAFIENLRDSEDGDIVGAIKNLKMFLEKRGEVHLFVRVMKTAVNLLEREGRTKIISRYPLSDTTKKHLVGFLKKNFEKLEGTTVTFETDEKILGGVRISHKDFLFDGTINTQLQKLTQK